MKTQHSESFNKRINNPNNEFKSEEEHMAHFKLRFKERFDVELTTEQYYTILDRAINSTNGKLVYKPSRTSSIIEMIIEGHLTWVLYGKKGVNKELNIVIPARLKTVMIPYTTYIVPVDLSKKYNHTTFTDVVNETINKIKKSAAQINPSKQNPYKILSGLSPMLRPVAKKIFKNGGKVTNTMIYSIVDYLRNHK